MIKNIVIVALGALSYGMLSSFAKVAYKQGFTPGEITFLQAFIGALILWLIVVVRKKNTTQSSPTKKKGLIILAGFTMGISAYTYYLSVSFIPASLAIVLLMQMTWMSLLADWIFFKKKPTAIEIISSILIIIGTIVASNLLQWHHFNLSIKGILLGVVSAILYTAYVICTSSLGNQLSKIEKSALMTTGSAIIILLINANSIINNHHLFDIRLWQWGAFLAIFGTIIPPICFTWGMPKIGPSLSAILLTLELPAAVIFAHLILKEEITIEKIIGIIIMLIAIIALNILKTFQKKKTKNIIF